MMAANSKGEMFYTDIDGELWQYELKTDPPEAMYWETYKLKQTDIKIISGANKGDIVSLICDGVSYYVFGLAADKAHITFS